MFRKFTVQKRMLSTSSWVPGLPLTHCTAKAIEEEECSPPVGGDPSDFLLMALEALLYLS